jgi:phosphomethylpyrimidine synthase
MKITQEVREYAANMTDNEKADLEAATGMAQMSLKFKEMGSEVYIPAEPAE